MAFEHLSSEERELARRCLAACADGPFFPDDQFATLFGTSRDELRNILRLVPWPSPPGREVVVAIGSALGNLLGHPQCKDDRLAPHGVTREQIEQLSRRWLQA